MIRIGNQSKQEPILRFVFAQEDIKKEYHCVLPAAFNAAFLQAFPFFSAEHSKILLIGLGGSSTFEQSLCKQVAAKGVKLLQEYGFTEFSVDLSPLLSKFGLDCLWDVVEGISLGLYKPKSYKNKKDGQVCCVRLLGIDTKDFSQAEQLLNSAQNLADSILIARNFVNTPANRFTPKDMADAIQNADAVEGLSVQVYERDEITRFGMDAYLTVADSSKSAPQLIVMRYTGNPESDEITALVGKGITCDTGGYCLKGASSMLGIKGDMAGGAAVAGAVWALAKNKVKTNAVGIIPTCENRISPNSFVPGDVISSMSGKSIEVVNTDAEGRLLLADAVTFAIKQEKATRICDAATLTGSVVNALGFTTAGVFSNDEAFWKQFQKAYQKSGEKYWRLPIFDEHRKMIQSKIADLKNLGESYCGTITAAAFIEEFAEKRPWIHLDIAGTAWVDSPVYEFQSAGATGAGVTTMYFLCAGMEE
jgi:leucyl aminopeptidase